MPQKAADSRPASRQALLASILVLIIVCPLGYSVVRGVLAQAAGSDETFYELPDPQHQRCIWNKQGAEMRLHHWEHLRRIREQVVRYGNRSEKGLSQCKNCHTSRVRFCDRCHQAVSLTPDCFDCHYYP